MSPPLWILSLLFLCIGITQSHAKPKQRPRNVTAVITDVTGLQLTWLAPRQTADCPVKRYLIRLKHDSQKRSKTWKVDGNRHSLSLHDLQQDTWYSLRLVAVTCDGKGAPTRWIKVHTSSFDRARGSREDIHGEIMDDGTEEAAPSKPTYVRTRTYSDSVTLSWHPPEDRRIRVRGYMVGYGEGVPDVNWQYVDANANNVTIRNLKSATQYLISLRAFNNYGKGPVIYDLIYTRQQNTPTVGPFSPPTNLKAKVLSPSTAWLQWTDPSLGRTQQITDNRYYNVHYQPLPSGKTLSLIVKDLHVVLYDLTPGTNYLFKVRTVKGSQSSPFSLAIQNRTYETVPTSSPRSVKVSPGNDSHHALVSWRPPRQPNGEITAYMVMWTTRPNMPISEWQVRIIMGMSAHCLLKGLLPNTTYYLKVQAQNGEGYGPTASTVSFTMPDADYNALTATTKSSLLDERQKYDESTDETEDNFLFPDYDEDDEDNEDYEPDDGQATEVSLEEEEEENNTEFDDRGFSVDAITPAALVGGGEESWEHSGSSKNDRDERSLQVQFQSVVKHTVSAVVTWREPCEDAGHITRYQVRYHSLDSPNSLLDKYTPTNFVMIDNLRPNTRYVYKLKRYGSNGHESHWSDIGYLDTTIPDND